MTTVSGSSATGAAATESATGSAVVRVQSGLVRGVAIDGGTAWRAIPYAAPPVGPLRFAPPQPVRPWAGVRDATEHGARAWQSPSAPNPLLPDSVVTDPDEDCLHLSVTVPDGDRPQGGWPVLIWVHGGGYVNGSGAGGAVGDGMSLVSYGLIVVTLNYRLGALGFLHVGDALGADYLDGGASGLRDQVAAVQWVRDNIAAFGGDPAGITLYGVSAGAKSVVNLLAAPQLRGGVRSAISASGGGDHVASPHQALPIAKVFLRQLGISLDRADLLRDVAASDIVAAQEAMAVGTTGTWIWRPVWGGPTLPIRPIDAIAAGAARGVALLAGSNGNEGITFQLMNPTSAEQTPRVLSELFGPRKAQRMLDGYRASRPELDDTQIRTALFGDERYTLPTARLADAQRAHGPVWRYRFDRRYPGLNAVMDGGHGMDMMPIWGPLPQTGDPGGLGATVVAMRARWATMARDSEPNPPDAADVIPAWPQYGAQRQTMVIDALPHIEDDPRGDERRLWGDDAWPSGTWWDYLG
jgi:para-nitrobenzyl esterase